MDDNQNELNERENRDENAELNDDHSYLLSKLIYAQLKREIKMKCCQFDDQLFKESQNSKKIHPEAPLSKLSDILRKKLNIKNAEISEEEFENLHPQAPRKLLSHMLIDYCPSIFRKMYSNYNVQE